MHAPAHPGAAAPRAWGAAARQAAGLVQQRRLQKVQVAAARRKGRPHRHAGSAGHRRAAAVLWRRHQVQPAAPGRRQDLRSDRAAGRDAPPRRPPRARCSRGAPWPAPTGRSGWRKWPLHRRRSPGAAHAQRAQEVDGKALYEYARAGIEVERAPRRDSRSDALELLPHEANWRMQLLNVALQQGHLHPHAGRRHRRALGCGAHLSALRRTHRGV
jgi:hypothetical protein